MLLEKKAISNTTVMICVEGAQARCELLKKAGFTERTGVHLQTTCEYHHKNPLSHPDEIPTLVDDAGYFKSRDSLTDISPEEIELEWDRQIVLTAEVLGQKPSHLDSHHGIHRRPEVSPVYLKLAAKYDIPVRGGRKIGHIDGKNVGANLQHSVKASGQDKMRKFQS